MHRHRVVGSGVQNAKLASGILTLLCLTATFSLPAADGLTFPGGKGPGRGKSIVFLSGDEEYRSEEGFPMLAKLLAAKHGFNCTVLFALNPADGTIDPNNQTNITGLAALDNADLCILGLRFRELPDAEMKHFVDYLNRGKPIIGLRTSTHAFAYGRNKQSPYVRFDWQNKDWPGGFGQQVLGETWVSHHGDHGKQSTRGVISAEFKSHPILRGVEDIWGRPMFMAWRICRRTRRCWSAPGADGHEPHRRAARRQEERSHDAARLAARIHR